MSSGDRIRVKVCGITRVEDALAAAAAGVDAIGLVFHAASPRHVSAERAQAIVAALPPFVTVVGLFVDASAAGVHDLLAKLSLDVLQFHGDEPEDYCTGFGRRYIKAIRMRDDADLHAASRRYASASALLADAYVPGVAGGTGTSFDWHRLPAGLACPVILAGGLTPANVATAIRVTSPWGVDVSGGVEQPDGKGGRLAGIKSAAAIAEFMKGVGCVRED